MAEQQSGLAHTRHQLAADNLALAEKAFRLGESDLAALLRARATAFATEAALKRQELTRSEAVSQLRQALGLMP
jgi:outer membrane protein TolC